MSKNELEEIKRLNKQLSEYQEKENTHEDLKHLPSLSIKDIPSDMPCIKTILDKNSPYKALYKHKIDTRKIAYLRAYFDLSKLTIDELVYLTIFRWLTFETKTKKYSASDLNKYIRIHLGDLAFGMLNQSRSKDEAKLYFTIDASSLEGNIKYIPHFINEIIFNSLPSKKDVDRILKKQISRLKTNINNGSTPLAILEAESQISSEAKLDFEVIKGRKLLIKIIEISKNVSFKEIKNNINKVIEKVFTKDNAIFFIACDKKVYTKLKKSLNKFKLSEKHFDDALSINIDNNEHKRAFVIPSNVNYNAAVKSLEDYSLKYCGKFLVLSHILNLTYLWENVRVKGGAYGTGFSVKPNNTMIFSSYRDPNVKTTFETFSKVGDFLKMFSPSKEEFESFIVGAVGSFDTTPSLLSLLNIAENYILRGENMTNRRKLKKEILKTKLKDIKTLGYIFDNFNSEFKFFTYGSKEQITNFDFDKIEKL